MKLLEFTDYNSRSKAILNESWELLTEHQKIHVNAWEKRVWPLMEQINVLLEADLTADQIQQIFANAEKLSAEQGTGLTALGKAGKVTAEVSSQLKQEISKLLDQAKNSEPVKNMDAQFDKLRSEIAKSVQSMPGGDKILAGVDKWKTFAKENPGKSAFIIGAMTSLLAFASGGAMSGAAIGFFLRLANNTIKGDQLTTALGKGATGAAIGAVAGGISNLISDLVPPEVKEVIVASDGQTIDVDGLEAMSATSLEDLDPEAAGDLLKTQNALRTAFTSIEGVDTDSSEAREMIREELKKVSQKINDLGGAEELQNYAGLEGQDLERHTISSSSDGTVEVVEVVPAETITAERLQEAGINFDTQPDISPEVVQWAEDNGLDPDLVQKYFQMKKGLSDAKILGVEVSESMNTESAWAGEEPVLETTTLPDGNEVQVGEKFTIEISTTVGGIEPPLNFTSKFSIEGVDANGNPVFKIGNVTTGPSHPLITTLEEAIDNDVWDQLEQYLKEYAGLDGQSQAGKKEIIDSFKQKVAKSIGAAATATVVGGLLANKEIKARDNAKDEKGSDTTASNSKATNESNYYDINEEDLADQLLEEFELYCVPAKEVIAEGLLNEGSSDEAWELVGQPVPEIQQFVKQMGYGNDEQSVEKITQIIDSAKASQIPFASIPKLKNLANKGDDAQTLKAVTQISGRPDAEQQYIKLMQARDASEGRERDITGYIQYVKSGNYDPPVLLKLPTGLYVVGGRTRLYAALALGVPASVKILRADNFKQSVAEGPVGDAAKNFAKSVGGVAAAGAKKVGQGIAGAAKKGAQAVKTGAQAAGKELGQKVTVRKLNSLWKKMGSPTDTGSIANLLSDVGMSDEQIGTVGQENNVELKVDRSQQQQDGGQQQPKQQQPQQQGQQPQQQQSQQSASNVDVETLVKQINSLPPYGRKKIKDELKKQLKK